MISLLLLVETCPFWPTALPAPVAQVAVVADSASLDVGSETGATATLTDDSGNLLTDRSVTWSSSDTTVATVLASGPTTALVTTLAEGSATVSATSEGKTGGASIAVTSPQTPPTSGGEYPNQPDGYAPITSRGFSAEAEDAWTATSASTYSISSDTSAPWSPSPVGQMRYPAGATEFDPGWTERSIAGLGYGELYLSFWVKLASNWQGHDSYVNKIGFAWIDGGPTVVFVAIGKDQGPLSAQVRTQGTPQGDRNLTANLTHVEVVRGSWHRWEVILKVNSGDNADGELHWWVDGVKVGEYRDLSFTSSTQGKIWELITWRPIWGGRGDTVIEDMYMWMDHYYASGR